MTQRAIGRMRSGEAAGALARRAIKNHGAEALVVECWFGAGYLPVIGDEARFGGAYSFDSGFHPLRTSFRDWANITGRLLQAKTTSLSDGHVGRAQTLVQFSIWTNRARVGETTLCR